MAIKKIPVAIAAVCLTFLMFFLAPLPKGPAYPFPSVPELIRSTLAVPMFVTALGLFLVACFRVWKKNERLTWLACLLMCLPYPVFALQGAQTKIKHEKYVNWPQHGMFLRDRLVEYHKRHPNQFHYIGSDEEIRVDGFADHLKASEAALETWKRVRIRDGVIVDPWNNPVRYGMDRNHDGYIKVGGRDFLTDRVSPPSLDYKTAVLVMLAKSPPGSGGGLGQHVGRY
jgi:hypothetical protein